MRNILIFILFCSSCNLYAQITKTQSTFLFENGILYLLDKGVKDTVLMSGVTTSIIDYLHDKDTISFVTNSKLGIMYGQMALRSNNWRIVKREIVEQDPNLFASPSNYVKPSGYPIEYSLLTKDKVLRLENGETKVFDYEHATIRGEMVALPPDVRARNFKRLEKKRRQKERRQKLKDFFSIKNKKNKKDEQ